MPDSIETNDAAPKAPKSESESPEKKAGEKDANETKEAEKRAIDLGELIRMLIELLLKLLGLDEEEKKKKSLEMDSQMKEALQKLASQNDKYGQETDDLMKADTIDKQMDAAKELLDDVAQEKIDEDPENNQELNDLVEMDLDDAEFAEQAEDALEELEEQDVELEQEEGQDVELEQQEGLPSGTRFDKDTADAIASDNFKCPLSGEENPENLAMVPKGNDNYDVYSKEGLENHLEQKLADKDPNTTKESDGSVTFDNPNTASSDPTSANTKDVLSVSKDSAKDYISDAPSNTFTSSPKLEMGGGGGAAPAA